MRVRTILEFVDTDNIVAFNRDDLYIPSGLHSHDYVELEYVLSGEGMQTVNGVDYPIARGDVILLEVGAEHSYYSTNALEIINCILSPAWYNTEKAHIAQGMPVGARELPVYIHLMDRRALEIEDMFLKMELESIRKAPNYQLVIKNYLSLLLLSLFRYANTADPGKSDTEQWKQILAYIHTNLHFATLEETSRHFNYNTSYFSKLFKRTMGVNFSQYVMAEKMAQAKSLILNTGYPIDAIFQQVGFHDKKNFYTAFKAAFGMTPNAMRTTREKKSSSE